MLKVCKDGTTPQGRLALAMGRDQWDAINDGILNKDVEDPAEGRFLHLFLNKVKNNYVQLVLK